MNVYRDEIERLADLNGGLITPAEVVREAANPASPLHAYFEWDDLKAAGEHRLDQARELIASVRVEVTYHSMTYTVPAYLRNPALPADQQGYVATSRLTSRRDQALEAISAEIAQVAGRIDRAREIGRGLDLSAEVEQRLRALI